MATTYTPIATTTLGSAQSSVTFSSISGSYTDLVLVVGGSMATAASGVALQFNSDTGNNYSNTVLYGDGSAAGSTRSSNVPAGNIGYMGTDVSNTIGSIMNYSNTTTYKTAIGRGNTAGNYALARVVLWRSTAAITSITVKNDAGGNFSSGTVFTLYGILSA